MAYGVINVEQLTTQSGFTLGAGNASSFKNRIINGAMVIDQRNAGASVSGTSGVFTLDRWKVQNNSGSARFNVQQNAGSVTPPAGFANYLGVTSTGSYSVAAGDVISMVQAIEGYNTADFAWGTASASTITVSFWVRSSLTGTFGGALKNAGASYSYPFTYTISSANTWEQKSITITGATASTFASTTSASIEIYFSMGTGSTFNGTAGAWAAADYRSATGATNLVGTNGATFYITGVQLEVGTVATSFDYRPYGTELALCQRYCLVDTNDNSSYRHFAVGFMVTTTAASYDRQLPVTMRAAPSITVSSGTAFLVDGVAPVTTTSVTDSGSASTTIARLQANVASGLVAGQATSLASDGVASRRSITYSAEL